MCAQNKQLRVAQHKLREQPHPHGCDKGLTSLDHCNTFRILNFSTGPKCGPHHRKRWREPPWRSKAQAEQTLALPKRGTRDAWRSTPPPRRGAAHARSGKQRVQDSACGTRGAVPFAMNVPLGGNPTGKPRGYRTPRAGQEERCHSPQTSVPCPACGTRGAVPFATNVRPLPHVRDKRSGAIRHERPSLAPRARQEERCHSPRTSVPCPACGTRGAVPFATNVRPLPRVRDKRSGAIRHKPKRVQDSACGTRGAVPFAMNVPLGGTPQATLGGTPQASQEGTRLRVRDKRSGAIRHERAVPFATNVRPLPRVRDKRSGAIRHERPSLAPRAGQEERCHSPRTSVPCPACGTRGAVPFATNVRPLPRVRDKRSGAIRHERPSLAPRAGQEERCHSPRTSVPCPACGTRGAVPFATNVRPLPRVRDKRSGAIRHERPSLAPRAGQEERCHSPRTSVPCPACGTRGAVPFATNVRPLPRVRDKRSGAIRHEPKRVQDSACGTRGAVPFAMNIPLGGTPQASQEGTGLRVRDKRSGAIRHEPLGGNPTALRGKPHR
ncbi:hypothetical protein P7K49_040823 [Saguinus oedipus]|uniref:Uncharacterized protein n=1 Tax=Saguinus oedipus TaxID=9490 RepID=A0ABQ9TD11_SAGOE|nr:hypothetical protein P7K49_040823 [Saguinus oedipus]